MEFGFLVHEFKQFLIVCRRKAKLLVPRGLFLRQMSEVDFRLLTRWRLILAGLLQ
jgi:hypothetical protein